MIGVTPLKKGRRIRVPEDKLWYVRPTGALSGVRLDDLARELKAGRVPGLDLSDHWELTDASLRHFRSLAQLRMLDLSRTRISDEGIRQIASLKRLEVLVLPESVTDRAMASLKMLPHLRELNLDQARITDAGMTSLSGILALEYLDLSSTRVTDAGLAALARLPSLKRLVLGALVTDAGAPYLRAMKALEEIDITQTQIGENGLAALAELPRLRVASLGRAVTEAGLARLAGSRSLKTLDLSRTNVTAAGVDQVARIETLEELALSQTPIGDECVPALARLSELRILDLSDTRVTSAGLAPLAGLKKLTALSLSWRKLTREDLQGMSRLKHVRTIVLNGVPLPEATMTKLRRLSPWDTVISLNGSRLGASSRADALVMTSSVSLPPAGVKPGRLPETPKPAYSPVEVPASTLIEGGTTEKSPKPARHIQGQEGPYVSLPSKQRVTVPAEVDVPLEMPERILSSGTAARPAAPPAPKLVEAAPQRVASPGVGRTGSSEKAVGRVSVEHSAPPESVSKIEADNLLQAITLQSHPSRGGAFSGLSGLRQLRETETLASLNRIAADASQPSVSLEEDKPENSLGEFSVGVHPSH